MKPLVKVSQILEELLLPHEHLLCVDMLWDELADDRMILSCTRPAVAK